MTATPRAMSEDALRYFAAAMDSRGDPYREELERRRRLRLVPAPILAIAAQGPDGFAERAELVRRQRLAQGKCE